MHQPAALLAAWLLLAVAAGLGAHLLPAQGLALAGVAVIGLGGVWALRTVAGERALQKNLLSMAVESEYRLLQLVNCLPQLVWTSTPDGACDFVNARWTEYSGLPAGRLLGSGWLERLHPDDRPQAESAWRQALATGGQLRGDWRILGADGLYRWFDMRAIPMHDAQGRLVKWFGANIDVDELRRAETEALAARAEALHASRLSMLGEMASTIAHEVTQPIAAAANYVEVARAVAGADPARLDGVLVKLSDQLTRAMDTIRKVRGFAGKREHEPSPHHLRPLLEEAATLALIGRVGGGVALGLDLPDELPPVLVDRVQIGQVFVNLLRNAAEAMAGCPRREIAVTARPAHGGDMVEIAVADTGPGLPDSVRARLFMPFTTSKPDGLGIGLSTSRAIVQSHCGEMWAEDAPGGGAVFRLTLPVASGEAHG